MTITDVLSWACTLLALYGTWLNAKQDVRGFWYWLIADILLCGIFFSLHLWPQALLFGVYTGLAIKGLVTWR